MTKRMVGCAVLALAGLPAIVRAVEVSDAEGPESWAGLKRHPAVVNPVGRPADDPNVLSLRGTWDFKTARRKSFRSDEAPPTGGGYFWDPNDKPSDAGPIRPIQVPSCWELQGVGDSGTSTPCLVRWDVSPKPLRHGYVNEGWYRKRVTIPVGWKNRRIWLKTGWVNSQGCFWVNGHPVAWDDSYCGTYKYDVTDYVKPGEEACVVVQVMNYLPSRRGTFNSVHRWGGIIRDIEFEATPSCFIDDAWVRGDFDRQEAEVHVVIEGKREEVKGKRLRVTVEDETVEVCLDNQTIKQSNNQTILKVPLRNFKAWSPEHPNLFWAKIELLKDGEVVQVRKERFGVRKIEVRGDQFYLNGKPFFFRGVGWHAVDPIHGEVPADRDYVRKIVRRIRDAGFNAVRFHTHCKSPECFEAADELGLLIQPELPYYNDWTSDYFAFDPLGDALELWRNYRRYPSFAVYCGGNEGDFGPVLSARLYAEMKRLDPDRLFYGQDAVTTPVVGKKLQPHWGLDDARVPPDGTWLWNGPDASDFIGGPTTTWPRGSFDYGRPFICHEYLNLTVKSDARLEDRFTGVWLPPITRAERTAWLAKFGLDEVWGDRLQDAQHALQKYWIKHGLEWARADPYCDGYSYWSLQDTSVHADGTVTAQGLFNPFLEEKPCGTTVADCRVFNSPTCVLLDAGSNAVFRASERMPFRILLQHYGEAPLENARLSWTVATDDARLADGARDLGMQAIGPTRTVESVDFTVPEVGRPVKAVLTATVTARSNGQEIEQSNSWAFWFYPSDFPKADVTRAQAKADGVTVGTAGSEEVRAAIAAGGRVISVVPPENEPNVKLGWWWMGSQVGMVFASHPALKYLPHDGVLSPLFFRIVKKGALKLPLEGVRAEDLLVVGEGRDACYAYLAERRYANGAREMIVSGLDLGNGTPEGDALLKGIVEWLR